MLSRRLLASHFDRFDELLCNQGTFQPTTHSSISLTKAKSQLNQGYPPTHSQSTTSNDVEPVAYNAKDKIVGYLSLLESFMDILEQNLKRNLVFQAETEIGTDLVNQAEKFLSHHTHRSTSEENISIIHSVASVVLVSAVLERILRLLGREKLQSMSIYGADDFEQLNHLINGLEDVKVIDSSTAQQICFWLSLREKVVMNQPEQLDPADIQHMIGGTRTLLETVVKPAFT
ncbi:hypothetical protein H6G89_18895 [Oscillatoria sp. FACHB-1407]|uniref:hypothetical protein n=1 Tax=Oscillatoria sp. FACHB-1407 TaxID=2692847 RepID=UPI001684FC58|nr:hypothetical protein [Oscillatoria sp. FACHB-1407]MBD2463107.1 hypothetical protein [Oscillatoria sp. FACHB-1407]